MEQVPEPDSRAHPDPPVGSPSVVTPLLVSTLRGLGRGASLVYRAGKGIDDAMGRLLEVRKLKTEGKSQALSLIGSGAILISAFAPILNVPVLGSLTYFNGNSQFALVIGVLLVALGVAALLLALVEQYAWLYPIGFCSVVVAIGSLVSWRFYQARADSAPSAPASGLIDYFTRSASKGLVGRSSLSFGLPLLIYGAVLVMLAAMLRPRTLAAVTSEPRPG